MTGRGRPLALSALSACVFALLVTRNFGGVWGANSGEVEALASEGGDGDENDGLEGSERRIADRWSGLLHGGRGGRRDAGMWNPPSRPKSGGASSRFVNTLSGANNQLSGANNQTNSSCLLGYFVFAPPLCYKDRDQVYVWRAPPGELEHDRVAFYRCSGGKYYLFTWFRLTAEEKLKSNEGVFVLSLARTGHFSVTLENQLGFVLARSSHNISCQEEPPPPGIQRNYFYLLPIVVLILLSGLFSGLTLGLLSLDKAQLQIIIDAGKPRQKKYAKAILPIRKRGNWLLCTLLLGNVMVNAALSILSADIFDGTIGFLLSSSLIVVFGEILPQAICARHGLLVGYYTRWIVIIFMVILFPLAFPISKILDLLLGREIGQVYSRGELKQLLAMHARDRLSDLTGEEAKILSGAMDLSGKTIAQIMTPLADVFMLEIDTKLNSEVMAQLLERGHSRIPIYEKEPQNIVGLVFLKDFALVNPEMNVSVRSLLQYYGRALHKLFPDTPVGEALGQFKSGGYHLAVVHYVVDTGEGDPFYENIGIVTMEDVLEELIQDEIVDEYDEYVDMRGAGGAGGVLAKVLTKEKKVDYNMVRETFYSQSRVPRQQLSGLTAFLANNVACFADSLLKQDVLEALLSHNSELVEIEANVGGEMLYERGKIYKYFMIILQGKVDIRSGAEQFVCDGGPFTYCGIDALLKTRYVCDFNARAIGAVQLLKITKAAYDTALHASRFEVAEYIARGLMSPGMKGPGSGSASNSSGERGAPVFAQRSDSEPAMAEELDSVRTEELEEANSSVEFLIEPVEDWKDKKRKPPSPSSPAVPSSRELQ